LEARRRRETDHLKLQAARLRDSATEFIEKVRHDVTRKEDLHDAVEAGTNGHRESAHIGNASAAGAAWVQ